MKYMDGVIVGCLLLCGFGASPLAQACTTDGWSDVTGLSTTLFVGQPSGTPNTMPRFSELCAMRVTGTGSVRDLSPDHTRIRARFYVLFSQLTNATGTAVLLRAYPNETDTSPLFEIRRNNGNLIADTTGAGGAASTPFAAPAGWVAIEFDWQSGGTMSVWVNANAATAPATFTVASGSGTVSSVRMGAIAGLGGFTGALVFDAYEAHSTTPVGLLLAGDANPDEEINVFDFGFIRNEILGNSLATGQPDCNKDGDINVFDFGCIRNIILGN